MIEVVVGIDYSMTAPATCIHPVHPEDGEFNFKNCKFLIQSDKKQPKLFEPRITHVLLPKTKDFGSPEHRWDMISQGVFVFLLGYDVKSFGVEDYSFASKSNNMFDVGENTGVLKHKAHKAHLKVRPVNVVHVKQMSKAEGGGNATKYQILQQFKKDEPEGYAFLEKTVGVEVKVKVKTKIKNEGKPNEVRLQVQTEEVSSPAADIIDSYYLTKFLYLRYHNLIPEPVSKAELKKLKKAKKK